MAETSTSEKREDLTAISRVRHWLGLESNIVVMLAATLILGMGEELWSRFIPKYIEMLGGTVWAVAAYGTLRDLLDAVYQYPGGWLADKLGRRASLVLFTLLAMVGYLLYFIGGSWTLILVGTVFVMAWSSLTLPAVFAVIGDNLPKSRRAIGFGVQSILKRAPIMIAPAIGGWLIVRFGLVEGVRAGLAVTLLLAAAAIWIVLRGYRESAPPAVDTVRARDIWRAMDPRLKHLLAADCIARWAEGIPKVFIILYVTNILKASSFQFGWLTSVQMLAAILVYIPIAKLSDSMNRKPFVLLTFAFFALFPLVLAQAAGSGWLIAAFVVAGLREIGEPARKSLIVDLASESTRGRSVGIYYLIRGLVVFPASIVGGLLWKLSPQAPFYVAFAIGLVGLGVYALWGPGEPGLTKKED